VKSYFIRLTPQHSDRLADQASRHCERSVAIFHCLICVHPREFKGKNSSFAGKKNALLQSRKDLAVNGQIDLDSVCRMNAGTISLLPNVNTKGKYYNPKTEP